MNTKDTSLPPLPDRDQLLARVKRARKAWDTTFRPHGLEAAGPGEKSVWDYPRPPSLMPAGRGIRVMLGDIVIAETRSALIVRETAGAPVPYLPPTDVRTQWLRPSGGVSVCEWKGAAVSWDCAVPDRPPIADAAWCYPDPFGDLPADFTRIAGWFAFYPARLECYWEQADGAWARVRPQPGGFYGGWVTDAIKGPIKGSSGTGHW